MRRRKFLKLYEELKERIEREGVGSLDYLLGYLEGKGNQKLTGYQIGALFHLFMVSTNVSVNVDSEVVENTEMYFSC